MEPTDYIWFNGNLVKWQEAKIHVLSHTLHYGTGALEGIRCYPYESGCSIFKLSEHVERLLFSANTLGMVSLYSKETICDAIIKTVRVNKLKSGYIRPIIFFGYGSMKIEPGNLSPELAIACWPLNNYLGNDIVDIKTSQYIRIHPDSTVVSAKLCGHYLNSMLASLELKNSHYHEVLFLDQNKNIAEGAGENIFLVKNDTLYTPQVGTILNGITRKTVMDIADDLKLNVIETDLTLQDAYDADEAFFTGTAVEITSIRSINDKLIGRNQPYIVTPKIKKAYLDVVYGKNTDFLDCLTFVKIPEPELISTCSTT